MSDRSTLAPRDRRAFALPVHTLWRPVGRTWKVIAHGPMDTLAEMAVDGDEVRAVGDLPDAKDAGLKLRVF